MTTGHGDEFRAVHPGLFLKRVFLKSLGFHRADNERAKADGGKLGGIKHLSVLFCLSQ